MDETVETTTSEAIKELEKCNSIMTRTEYDLESHIASLTTITKDGETHVGAVVIRPKTSNTVEDCKRFLRIQKIECKKARKALWKAKIYSWRMLLNLRKGK